MDYLRRHFHALEFFTHVAACLDWVGPRERGDPQFWAGRTGTSGIQAIIDQLAFGKIFSSPSGNTHADAM